jgi:hypothetical protein
VKLGLGGAASTVVCGSLGVVAEDEARVYWSGDGTLKSAPR